jgi:hypothetical protein
VFVRRLRPVVGYGSFAFVVLWLGLAAVLGVEAPTAAADTCPNAIFRIGPSAKLPDCRAYELITPENTGGLRPTATNFNQINNAFDSSLISPAADSVMFQTVGGALPGTDGTGFTDRYEAIRSQDGWSTRLIGPMPQQTEQPMPGGVTPDHSYYFLGMEGTSAPDYGSLAQTPAGKNATYLRLADGDFEPLGEGSLGSSLEACGRLITPTADHVIFSTPQCSGGGTAVQLEPDAPPTGTGAIYDRSPGGITHVVSLLPGPGGGTTPAAGERAFYRGSSADGTAVAFELSSGPNLYVRVGNSVTYEVTPSANTYAGLSASGRYLFYANATSPTSGEEPQTPADLFSFDTTTQTTTQITNTGDAQFANVAADGSRVYFVSPSQIGGQGIAGEPNLYVWSRDADQTTFVATVDPSDVTGDRSLVSWTSDVTPPQQFIDAGGAEELSRATLNGSVLAFESHAELTPPYENAGHTEIYRYDAGAQSLVCASCNPSGGPATADASLQDMVNSFTVLGSQKPLPPVYPVANVTEDGGMVFFQSRERLSSGDANDVQDIYRWRNGEIALISSGRSRSNDFLYAASGNGGDVVFLTSDPLLPQDQNGSTGALYDARVNGGFPQKQSSGAGSCVEESCQGNPAPVPGIPNPGTSSFFGPGSQVKKRKHAKHCGKHKHHKHQKCVKKKTRSRSGR